VSKSDGSQDTENQSYQLREFCQRNGWKIVREYSDRASGTTAKRSQFQQMMSDVAQRRFDVCCVWALDRFTREGIAEAFDYIKRLTAHGCQFVSFTDEHFRTNGPLGELLVAIAAWLSAQESKRRSERTLAGLARARRDGKPLGRPVRICDRTRVHLLRSEGMSLGTIAAEVKLSKTTIARLCA